MRWLRKVWDRKRLFHLFSVPSQREIERLAGRPRIVNRFQRSVIPASFFRGAVVTTCIAIGSFTELSQSLHGAQIEQVSTDRSDKLRTLIDQLGSPTFAQRERARRSLQQAGNDAFDVLYESQRHPNPEVRLAVRTLLNSLTIRWIEADDPDTIKSLLDSYALKSVQDRKGVFDMIMRLPVDQRKTVLVRFVRFETSEVLSKTAALRLIQSDLPLDESERKVWIDRIKREISVSRRNGAEWVVAYLEDLETGSGLKRLLDFARKESETFATSINVETPVTERELVFDLFQTVATKGDVERDREIINAAYDELLKLVERNRVSVQNSMDWFLRQNANDRVEKIAKDFSDLIDGEPELMLRVAEALARQGKAAEAEQIAKKALGVLAPSWEERSLLAQRLDEFGLTQWGIYLLKETPWNLPDPKVNRQDYLDKFAGQIELRYVLVGLLQDQLRIQECVDAFQPILTELEKLSPEEKFEMGGNEIRQEFHFFRGQVLESEGKIDEARREFELAIKEMSESQHENLLIGLYRTSTPESEMRKYVQVKIDAAVSEMQTQIHLFETRLTQIINPDDEVRMRKDLAETCNNLAWLIANTYGSLDDAQQHARRAVRLRPTEANYYDTLAKTLAADGKIREALHFQNQAIKMRPSSKVMARQLAEIEKVNK